MKKSTRLTLIPAIILALFLQLSCASSGKTFREKRPNAISNYLAMQPNKALAIFRTSDNQYGYGFSNDYNTVEGARRRALRECQVRQQDYENLEEVCRIYMVNDEEVSE